MVDIYEYAYALCYYFIFFFAALHCIDTAHMTTHRLNFASKGQLNFENHHNAATSW